MVSDAIDKSDDCVAVFSLKTRNKQVCRYMASILLSMRVRLSLSRINDSTLRWMSG
jgi:hypothetical protein